MNYKDYLEEVGLSYLASSDLRIIGSILDKKAEQQGCPQNIVQQSIAINSIIAYPAEWGYDFPPNIENVNIMEVDEQPEIEEVNAQTYFGKSPKQKGYLKGDYIKTSVPSRHQGESSRRKHNPRRDQALWQHRRSMHIDLGPLNQRFDGIRIPTKAINDKGEVLSCDNPDTRLAEIVSWENAMDIALGQHGREWNAEQRLAYMISYLSGLARATWEAASLTEEYEAKKKSWIDSQGNGPFLGNLF